MLQWELASNKKLQRKDEQVDAKKTKIMINILLIGFIVFVALFFIFKTSIIPPYCVQNQKEIEKGFVEKNPEASRNYA